MPTLERHMLGKPYQSNVGNSETNTHHRTQADLIGSDPTCAGEGPDKGYLNHKNNPVDHTGQQVFGQR